MANKKLYLAVNVASGSGEHIGTIEIVEPFQSELTEKVKKACKEHFNFEVEVPILDVNNYINGNSGDVKIVLIDDEERMNEEISISQTWLY
jgi:hypothetical protein